MPDTKILTFLSFHSPVIIQDKYGLVGAQSPWIVWIAIPPTPSEAQCKPARLLVPGGTDDLEEEEVGDVLEDKVDLEEVEEEVDDVQVEVEGGEDILLRVQRVLGVRAVLRQECLMARCHLVVATNHHLGVEHDVEAEDDGT